MKKSQNAPILTKFKWIAAGVVGVLFSSVSVWAQSGQLLVIESNLFYPAGGYPSTIANQNLPAGYQQISFRADSGQPVVGQLTIRCRGGREHRNVSLTSSGYRGSSIQNPCDADNLFNFDLYLSSPQLGGGRYDRIRVYGDGRLSAGGGGYGYGDLMMNIDYNRFYPAAGYMAIGSQDLSGGYRSYTLVASDRYSSVNGKLTIRCRGDRREFRDVFLSPTSGRGASFTNPCSSNSLLNIDIYLTSPRVGAGTYGRLQVYGNR